MATLGAAFVIAVFQIVWLIPGVDYNANRLDEVVKQKSILKDGTGFLKGLKEGICK